MEKIDSHQHFWQFNAARDSWITNEMFAIKKDFLPAHLKPVLADNKIDGCIAVEAEQSESQNIFLLQLANENQFIKGIVGWVDLEATNIEERLEYYSGFEAMKGFRHGLQSEPDRAMMLKPSFMKGMTALAKHSFTFDLLILADQLQYITHLVSAFPNQKFIIDHLAKPNIKGQELYHWRKDIKAVAAYKNVYCKVSGMVTEADWMNWSNKNFEPYINTVFEAFGADRLMFGSDWPVCLLAGSYADVIDIISNYTSNLTKSEQEVFWGGNALEFYNI